MSSYWDYFGRAMRSNGYLPNAVIPSALEALYNRSYDNSHGSARYWHKALGGPFALKRRMSDSAKEAEDTYRNTGVDSPYIDRYGGPSLGAVVGLAGGSGGAVGMARSLSDLYTAEVIEDVQKSSNFMYM